MTDLMNSDFKSSYVNAEGGRGMVFNATFNNITVISWQCQHRTNYLKTSFKSSF